MVGTVPARLLRTGIALLLCLALAGGAIIGPTSARAQDEDAPALPGFDPFPPEAALLASASGAIDEGGVATLLVERLAVEPGSELGLVAGPFVLIVEQGSLVYADDLGLEAEVSAGSAQFFAAGDGDSLANANDEQTIVLRVSLITDAPIDGEPGPEDGGDDNESGDDTTDGEAGDEPDGDDGEAPENRPVRPRGDDDEDANAPAGVNALILQETAAPDEVVISLTDDGFTPGDISIATGGVLVIENASDLDCEFSIADLDIAIDLESGDIEQTTIDGPAGEYTFECTDASGDRVGDGVMSVVGGEDPVEEPVEEETPDAEETATPDDEPTETPAADDAGNQPPAMIGILVQATISLDDSGELFGASLTLEPGGTLSLAGADGALGLAVSGGDLTVLREGRSPAALRDGLSVVLPGGTSAELTNDGETTISLVIAGVTGSSIASDLPPVETPEPDDPDLDEPEEDDTSGSVTGGGPNDALYAFFPNDSDMADLGLVPLWNAFTEVSDAASNNFWLSDRESAEDAFTGWNWLKSSELRYSSVGEETDFGEVTVFGILVDAFEDEAGADGFFSFLNGDPSGEATDLLDGVDSVDAAIEFNLGSGANAAMFVVIHSGSYVITLFTTGPELDTRALMEAVTGLMFGIVG